MCSSTKTRVDTEGRVCTKCGQYKLWAGFPGNKYAATGHAARCQSCATQVHTLWVEKNSAEVERKRKQKYELNKVKLRAEAKNRRAELPKGALGARHKAWRDKNPEHCKEYTLKRKALLGQEELNRRAKVCRKNNPEAYLRALAKSTAARGKGKCVWADNDAIARVYLQAAELTRTTGIKHHVDHIVPLTNPTAQGLHNEFNLRAIPAKVNLEKRNRLDEVLLMALDTTYWMDTGSKCLSL